MLGFDVEKCVQSITLNLNLFERYKLTFFEPNSWMFNINYFKVVIIPFAFLLPVFDASAFSYQVFARTLSPFLK